MRISPISIKRQEFSKSFRGFDTEEVQAFLEKIAEDVEALNAENDSLKKVVDENNSQLLEYRRIEKNLQETLLKAHENSAKSMESTKKQAGLMLKEAEIKAQQIIDKAKESANEIRNSIISLREERDVIIAKLKGIVSTQSNLLEMRVEKAGDEPAPLPEKKTEPQKKFQVNIDQVIDKLL
ncbi:MAG: DivIVA domain-containing protein [Ignavibacteriales bacterium]|nr:DivIVA domain-containing protein [Ignavibacteriales bacterium]